MEESRFAGSETLGKSDAEQTGVVSERLDSWRSRGVSEDFLQEVVVSAQQRIPVNGQAVDMRIGLLSRGAQ